MPSPFEYSNVKSLYEMLAYMSTGHRNEHKKIKEKAEYIYRHQKEDYMRIFKELCGTPITLEEKRQVFGKYGTNMIKDRDVCMISKNKSI